MNRVAALGGWAFVIAVLAFSQSTIAGTAPHEASVSLQIGDPAYRECVFARAGVTERLKGLDPLDRDLLFLAAARERLGDFLTRQTKSDPPRAFRRLLSVEQSARLLRLAKAHDVCLTRSGRRLYPWPLAAQTHPTVRDSR